MEKEKLLRESPGFNYNPDQTNIKMKPVNTKFTKSSRMLEDQTISKAKSPGPVYFVSPQNKKIDISLNKEDKLKDEAIKSPNFTVYNPKFGLVLNSEVKTTFSNGRDK